MNILINGQGCQIILVVKLIHQKKWYFWLQIHGWVCALCLQIQDYARYLYSLCYLSAKYGIQWITNDFETINLIYVDITKKINSDDYPSYYSPSLDINLILWIHIFSFLTISATWLKRRFDLCCSICMLLLKEPVIMVAMQATSDGQATGTSLFNDLLNF